MAKVYSGGQYFAVLAFAVFPMALYRRRGLHYVEHLIFALHIYSFYFILTSIASIFMNSQQWQRFPVLPFVTLAYIAFALRRLHGETWYGALWKGIVLRIGLFITEAVVLGAAVGISMFLTFSQH